MKLLVSALAFGFMAASVPAAEASCAPGAHCAMHVAHIHHHHYYAYGYPLPPGSYGFSRYYAPTGAYVGYVPGYFYVGPSVWEPANPYGPYPWSWGYRNSLNLLLNAEHDRPFTE